VEVSAIRIDKEELKSLRNASQRQQAIKSAQVAAETWLQIPATRNGFNSTKDQLVLVVITDAGDSDVRVDTDWNIVSCSSRENKPTNYRLDWNVLLLNKSEADLYVTISGDGKATRTSLLPINTASGFMIRNLILSCVQQ